MSRVFLTIAILLTATGLMVFPGCGDDQEETSMVDLRGPGITVSDSPDVSGWIEIALADEPPVMAEAGSVSTWLLFQGGNLMSFNETDGWRAFSIENAVEVLDMRVVGDVPVLLTSSSLLTLSADGGEAVASELPEGFEPVLMGCSGNTVALVDRTGDIAIARDEGFDLFAADENLSPAGNLVQLGPDWVFPLEGGGLAFFDPSVELWQFESSPAGEVLVASDDELFIGVEGEVLVRTEPSVWTHWADGTLYPSGLLLADQGVCRVQDTEAILSERPSFQPVILLSSGSGEPYWAIDQLGLAAYAEIGSVQATLSFCNAERVSCSLAGQTPASTGSTESVGDMLLSGSGAFRIYESVSMRPDPFTEFSAISRDIRRPVEELSIEELRLVGITLDPVGGDKAMVEDDLGVPYILYEGTLLRNSTSISEITANEVIVVQDVIVDYTATGGGVTRIPTIFSMRLHEEGGL